MNDTTNVFDKIRNFSIGEVASVISEESPSTIAIVLAHYDVKEAADILSRLNSDLKIEVAIRMSNLKDTPSAVVQNIATLIFNKLQLNNEKTNNNISDIDKVAKIFNQMGSAGFKILENMAMFDEDLANKIKDRLFLFENIDLIEPSGLRHILNNLDFDMSLKALLDAPSNIQEAFIFVMNDVEKRIFNDRLNEIKDAQNSLLSEAKRCLEAEEVYFEEKE